MSEVMNVEEIFGKNVFTLGKMKERLPRNVFKEVKKLWSKAGAFSCFCGRSGKSNEGLGGRKRRYALYALVSAAYRHYGGET